MQREPKWRSWPLLIMAGITVLSLLITAQLVLENHVISNYLEDLAGAITIVILSVLTYEEWERRKERRRYLSAEKMGFIRIQQELFQLLYEYAFVMNIRYESDASLPHLRTIKQTSNEARLHAKIARFIAQEDPSVHENLLAVSADALARPSIERLSYQDIEELIIETERVIERIDTAIAIYAYSFSAETHKYALDIRELLNQTITGKKALIGIRMMAISNTSVQKLSTTDGVHIQDLVTTLLDVGEFANKHSYISDAT